MQPFNASRKGVQAAGFRAYSFLVPPIACSHSEEQEIGGIFLSASHLQLRPIAAALSLLFALAFVACSVEKRNPTTQEADIREVNDEAGRRVSVPAKVERFISLAPNLTEIVYAVGAEDRLVGNTTFCDYPEAAKKVQKVGDTLQPSIERILALRPQLVLVSTASQLEAFTKQLDEHSIAVYVTDPHDLEGVFRSINGLGKLLNEEQRAQETVNQLRSRATSVTEAVRSAKPVKVFYQLSAEPLYTAGKASFVTDLIQRAGGISVTADVPEAWPRYSQESAVAARPEAIVLPTGGSMGSANSDVARGLKRSPAALSGRVYRVNGDFLSRPGPRAVIGLEQLARVLHPEAFKK